MLHCGDEKGLDSGACALRRRWKTSYLAAMPALFRTAP